VARVVILGGGFGGAAAARRSAQLLGDGHSVVLIDREAESHLCGVNPAVVVGEAEPVARSIAELDGDGLAVVLAEIGRIDLAGRRVETSAGSEAWDHLVIALGVAYDGEAVAGNDLAHSFYDHDSAMRLRQRMAGFDGGSVVIASAGAPYRCPPAMFETALMIEGHLRGRRVRDRSSITVVIPEPQPMGVAGPATSARIRDMLDDAGVGLATGKRVVSVDTSGITFDDGSTAPADVPIVVPRHVLPPVVRASGVAGDAPFVPIDRRTLETSTPGVYAIGDVNTIPVGEKAAIPKAGVFAAGQGRHVAEVIAHRLGVVPDPGPYDGVGHCFLMLGPATGASIGGDFFAPDGPAVSLDVPSGEGRRAKDLWERAWARFEV